MHLQNTCTWPHARAKTMARCHGWMHASLSPRSWIQLQVFQEEAWWHMRLIICPDCSILFCPLPQQSFKAVKIRLLYVALFGCTRHAWSVIKEMIFNFEYLGIKGTNIIIPRLRFRLPPLCNHIYTLTGIISIQKYISIPLTKTTWRYLAIGKRKPKRLTSPLLLEPPSLRGPMAGMNELDQGYEGPSSPDTIQWKGNSPGCFDG